MGVYRFLGLLQNQDRRGFSFQWGSLGSAAFLPRVRYGRTVFSLAQWNLSRQHLAECRKLRPAERLEAFQRFRQQMRLPRWVCLKDGDNVLPLDLDNTLSLETLLHLIKDRPYATLEELYPGPEELCVDSGEGRYIHELVVPFVRTAPVLPVRKPQGPSPSDTPRRFAPGSEWLYAKFYTGMATADRLLRSALADTLARSWPPRAWWIAVLHPLRATRSTTRAAAWGSRLQPGGLAGAARGLRALAGRGQRVAAPAGHLRARGGALRRAGRHRAGRGDLRRRQRGRPGAGRGLLG